jgi:hypothetical protein
MFYSRTILKSYSAGILLLSGFILISITARAQEKTLPIEKYIPSLFLKQGDKVVNKHAAYHLVQIAQPELLQQVSVIKQVDDNWYIIKTGIESNEQKLKSSALTILPAGNQWKLSDDILDKTNKNLLTFPTRFTLWWLHENDVVGRKVEGYPISTLEIKSREAFNKLIANKNLISIEECNSRKASTETLLQRYDPGTNRISFAHRKYPTANGIGKIVSVKENAFDTADVDLRNRWFFTSSTAKNSDGHATEMATLVGGSGNTGFTGKGVAYKARLTNAGFENLMPEPPSYYSQYKISVQNHSYGTGIENEYAADAAAYDLLSWNDSSLLHIFSAGNRCNQTPSTGTYQGIAGFNNLSGSFKMSKNSLSIGATDSFHHVETLSSRGPAYDGRIKPELVAFGSDGTSGAAALTSGAALVLQQTLHAQNGFHPPASLIKAILIGSAKDREEEGPSYISGYGNLDVFNAIQIAVKKHYILGTAENANENIFEIHVPSNTRLLKVTLNWTDTAATPQSAKALINDLDLVVEHSENNTQWLPWVLSTFPKADSLHLPAIRNADHRNTTEQVSILNPAPGKYLVKVKPYYLATAKQRFAIAYDIQQADSLYATYPSAIDNVPAKEKIPIRWEQTFAAGTPMKLEFAYTGNTNWQLINNNFDASLGSFYWQVPDTNATATFRFTINSKIFLSDTFFITGNPQLKPGYICPDTSLLTWKPLKGVAGYRIYTLGDTLMQSIGITTDTIYKLPGSTIRNNWVTIAPIASGNPVLESRENAFNILLQGVECYFKSFLAEWDNGSAMLRISLGTTYEIASVQIQKLLNGTFSPLQSFSPVNTTDFNYTDNNLTIGANTYKVVLLLTNGKTIESNVQTIIQPNTNGWWVFPNPVKRGGQLKIINRRNETEDFYLDILDMNGRKVKSMLIPLIDNNISVANLSAGMYIMVFTDGKKQIGIQKLLIQP